MKCSVCSFEAPTNPCLGCADQCRRLQVAPEQLRALGRETTLTHDLILKRAVEVGLLTFETAPLEWAS